ncbi:ecto-NOX disulfide-thiol exchanger 2-like [Arapaima gigas]
MLWQLWQMDGDSESLNPLSFNPATNNEPLQFNSTNGPLVSDCTLENGAESSKKRKRPSLPPEGIRNMTMDSGQIGMPMSDPNAWATAMNNLGMAPMSMTGQPLMSGEQTSHSRNLLLAHLHIRVPLGGAALRSGNCGSACWRDLGMRYEVGNGARGFCSHLCGRLPWPRSS